MRDKQHYCELCARNPNAGIGDTLSADAITAAHPTLNRSVVLAWCKRNGGFGGLKSEYVLRLLKTSTNRLPRALRRVTP